MYGAEGRASLSPSDIIPRNLPFRHSHAITHSNVIGRDTRVSFEKAPCSYAFLLYFSTQSRSTASHVTTSRLIVQNQKPSPFGSSSAILKKIKRSKKKHADSGVRLKGDLKTFKKWVEPLGRSPRLVASMAYLVPLKRQPSKE